MKNFFVLLMAITFGSPAMASYLESCDFSASVVEVSSIPVLDGSVSIDEYTPVVKILIESAVNQGSHNQEACSARVGTEQLLVSKMAVRPVVGQKLVIDYFYANSRGPDGVVSSERWTVLEGRSGKLAYSCWQTDRSSPTYQVQIRLPSDSANQRSMSYNVYITRDEATIISEDNVRVNLLSDQNGSIDRIFAGADFDLTLKADRDLGHSITAAGSLLLENGRINKNIQCVKAAE